MLICIDVDYRDKGARAAGVLFRGWTDAESTQELVRIIDRVEPYVPGQFYRRELPCLLAVVEGVAGPLDAILVDGYVWLKGEETPGLGRHLYEALGRNVPVIGVAKTCFVSARTARPIKRGSSEKPLYVTAAGIDVLEAARLVQGMHGPHRLPTLLKRVDQLCRNA
jgi:deoxyribonuclease V